VRFVEKLIRRTPVRDPGPGLNEAEVTTAVRCFQSLEPLVEATAMPGNDGFSASISFASSVHKSRFGLGSIEIGLRSAELQFHAPKDAVGWGWSDAVPELVKSYRQTQTLQESGSHRDTATTSRGSDLELAGEGGVSAPLFKAGLRAMHRRTRRTDRLHEDQAAWGVTKTLVTPLIAMKGALRHFHLRLTAPSDHDLSFFNADLVRQPFLHVPEPSSLDLNTVEVWVEPAALEEHDDSVVHTLKIRNATGAWAPLETERNKQVLGELVLSKFLKPMHRRRRLWPPPTGRRP
jgi:hypothetical protein